MCAVGLFVYQLVLSSILLLSAVVTLTSMTMFIGIHWLVDDIQRNST